VGRRKACLWRVKEIISLTILRIFWAEAAQKIKIDGGAKTVPLFFDVQV
jgi:hypothetical protein